MGLLPKTPWSTPQKWTPEQLPNLLSWYAGDREGGYENNDLVDRLRDLSGGGLDATATGTDRPVFKTNVINGQSALLFNQADGNCLTTPPITLTTFTLAIVCKLNTDAAVLLQHGPDGGGAGCYLWGDVGATVHVKKTDTSDRDATVHWAYSPVFTRTIVMNYTGTNAGLTLRVNGSPVALVDGTLHDDPGAAGITAPLHIGARAPATLACTGYIGEVTVNTPNLTLNQIQKLEQYLMARWGTT